MKLSREALLATVVLLASPIAPCPAATVQEVTLAVSDLAYHPDDRRIYASVRGGLVRIDPATGRTDPVIPVAGQPKKLVISDDGLFIHMLTDASNTITRLNLGTIQVDLHFQADTTPGEFHRRIWDIAAVPGRPRAILVSLYYPCCSPPGGGIVVFDDGELLPKVVQGSLGSSEGEKLAFDEVPERAFTYERALSSHHLNPLRVQDDGVVQLAQLEGVLTGGETSIWAGGGNVYTNYGPVLDAKLWDRVGTIGAGEVCPDPAAGRVFVLSIENPDVSVIKSYDQVTFKPLQTIRVPGTGNTSALRRFGERGLAFASESTVFLLDEDLVLSPSKRPFRRGHLKQADAVLISDAVSLLRYLFDGLSIPCVSSADVNDDGGVDVSDAINLLNFLFRGGPPPSPPFTECGLDATSDRLTCDSYPCG